MFRNETNVTFRSAFNSNHSPILYQDTTE